MKLVNAWFATALWKRVVAGMVLGLLLALVWPAAAPKVAIDHQRHPPPGARPAIGHAQQRALDAAALERLGEAQNMRCGGGLIGHGDPGWG